MELPKDVVAASTSEPRLLVLYSAPKCGKTTALAALPKCLLIDTEDGSNFVSALKVKAGCYRDFLEIANAVKADPTQYSALGIDTLTRVEEWAERDATEFYKKMPLGKSFTGESVLELPQGGGYYWLRRAFRRYIDLIVSAHPRVILMGHVREKFLTQAGKDVSAVDVDLVGKNRQIACSLADAIGHLYRNDKGELWVSFKTKETLVCGTRSPHLTGQEFKFDWSKIYPSLFLKP
jgi:hypothetical protein